MARIAGVDLPREKRVEIGITYIYGIGRPTATKILKEKNISSEICFKENGSIYLKKINKF